MADSYNKTEVVKTLNQILEMELSAVVCYTHYSFMIFGQNRISILNWIKEQITESLEHATKAGELITHLGSDFSLKIGPLLEKNHLSIDSIFQEARNHEKKVLNLYENLLDLVKDDKSILLEEYSRGMIVEETHHIDEIDKLMKGN